ncbi:ATP-dependent nuclease [Christiangramia crocea]|uniref:AAA family ATPase n=1 Tax=Christiangramia crocea TaxID=2904124 RepID=A0A9X1UWE6_9FLAO|nr:AAA family ATPase [Gramella crocea]MCG9970513.1 AAA family ATPase [Gramella crocea]
MYISKLEIKNYKNFRDFEIQLKPLTLIIGENNIGKSNLLNCLGLIFSQDVSIYKKRNLEISDFNYDCILNYKRDVLNNEKPIEEIEFPEIEIAATLKDWNTDQESVIGDWYINEELTEAKLTYIYSPVSSFNQLEELQNQRDFINAFKKDIGAEKLSQFSEKDLLDLINFPISKYYYSIIGGNQNETQANAYHLNQLKFELLDALRDAKTELSANNRGNLLFRVLNAKEENEYQDLKKQLVGLQSSIQENTAIQSIISGISTQLDKVSLSTENSNNEIDLIFSLPNVEDILKKLSLIYGENPLKIEHNGTGRNNLLFMSLILSYIEDPNSAQSNYFRVVGIEEPESHLHANLQNHLASNIESLIKLEGSAEYRKDIQLLLTSHSNHITTKIKFESTVVLYNKDGNLATHYVLQGFSTNAEDTKRVKYLRKYLDSENINLFYSRKIVLVEGISEKLLFPVFFEIEKSETMDKLSTCIVNVNGLAFKNFLDLIKNGYHTKCLVLTDSDRHTKAEDRAENLVKEYSKFNVISICISSESTFEKDIIACNKSGLGKEILIKVLKLVRPISGKTYDEGLGEDDINIEDYFSLIENFKSDFAFQLSLELQENNNGFIIPKYIKSGISFLNPETTD